MILITSVGNRLLHPLHLNSNGFYTQPVQLQASVPKVNQVSADTGHLVCAVMHQYALAPSCYIYMDTNYFQGFIGLVLNDYQPVSGNWCWLSAESTALRYALGHGWRLAIIFTIICLYTYLFVYMHQYFRSLREIKAPNIDSGADTSTEVEEVKNMEETYKYREFEVFHEFENGYLRAEIPIKEAGLYVSSMPNSKHTSSTQQSSVPNQNGLEPPPPPSSVMRQIIHCHHSETTNILPQSSFQRVDERLSLITRDPLALIRRPPPPSLNNRSTKEPTQRILIRAREFQIQKLLLLNAYPIAYILLWIPGILNRVAELSGHKVRALAIAQSSTQFVGLANSCKYFQACHISRKELTPISSGLWIQRKDLELRINMVEKQRR